MIIQVVTEHSTKKRNGSRYKTNFSEWSTSRVNISNLNKIENVICIGTAIRIARIKQKEEN